MIKNLGKRRSAETDEDEDEADDGERNEGVILRSRSVDRSAAGDFEIW